MPKLKKRVLVLSGGGAKIGFQVGVTAKLNAGFHSVVGVSCGAIWAAMLAQNKQLQGSKIILSLQNEDIYTGNFSLWNIAKRILTKKNYLLDMSPLRRLLEQNVRKEDFVIPAYFVYVDAVTGEKITACSDTLDTPGIIDAIMSSSAIPVVMEGVKNRYYDGGLEEVCPLGEAIALEPDEIVIVNCFNRAKQVIREKDSLIATAGWMFTDKMPQTIAKNSVDTFLMLNEVLRATFQESVNILWNGRQKTIKHFDYELYEPSEDLGDTLDFSKDLMKQRFNHGMKAVSK